MTEQNKRICRVITLVETDEEPVKIKSKIESVLGKEDTHVEITDMYPNWKAGMIDLLEQKGW